MTKDETYVLLAGIAIGGLCGALAVIGLDWCIRKARKFKVRNVHPPKVASAPEVEDHRLEILANYTIFHIGLYMTLVAALIVAATAKDSVRPFADWVIKTAIFLFICAGACGGLIAVNVAEFKVDAAPISWFFSRRYRLRLWNFPIAPYWALAGVEQ